MIWLGVLRGIMSVLLLVECYNLIVGANDRYIFNVWLTTIESMLGISSCYCFHEKIRLFLVSFMISSVIILLTSQIIILSIVSQILWMISQYTFNLNWGVIQQIVIQIAIIIMLRNSSIVNKPQFLKQKPEQMIKRDRKLQKEEQQHRKIPSYNEKNPKKANEFPKKDNKAQKQKPKIKRK